jgi:hypothetical protein
MDLNKPVFKIFKKEKELVKDKKCPLCSEVINEDNFKDILSQKEYLISGICQKCQDKVFK